MMRKRFRRITALGMAGAMTASLVGSTVNTAAAESEDTVYHYTLAMYNDGPWNDDVDSLDYYKELFPDMDFELVYVEKASAAEKVNLLIASGETPDVMQMVDEDTLYNQGVLGCWTEEFFRENCPNISCAIDETDPDAWALSKYDGENMYSIPGWNVARTYPTISVWNKKWLDAVGEEVPTTLEDAERVFYKFAQDDPDGNGKDDTYGLSEQGFKPIYGAFGMMRGMWLEDDDGNLVYGDVMPEAKEALTLLSKWYQDGVIDPEFITGESEGGYWALSQPLNKGKIGYTNAGWYYHWAPADEEHNIAEGSNVTEFKALNPDGELAYGVPLVGPNGDAGHKQEQPLYFRTHFSKELCEDTDRFARLLQFIDYVNGIGEDGNAEPVIIAGNGQEGVGWEYQTDEDGTKRVVNLLDGNTLGAMGYWGTFNFIESGAPLSYQKANTMNLEWVDELVKDYPESYVDKLYDTLESAGQYKSDLDKLLDEGYISIITGEQPIDYFDEMVELWYANGGQEMTDEANEWYSTVK